MDKEKELSLIELFLQLFQTPKDFINFLYFFPKESSIIANVSVNNSMRFLVAETVDELRRRGLINADLFERLIEQMPKESIHIKELQGRWIADIDKWGEPPEDKEKIKKNTDAPSVFISYSRRDEYFFEEFTTHLKLLQRKGVINLWYEGRIRAGENWDRIIETQIEQANIIILLISPDFLSSDFIWENEFSKALNRHKQEEASILPIIIRQCNWQDSPVANLQVLPLNGTPVSSSTNIDRVWIDIEKAVAQVAKKWRDKK